MAARAGADGAPAGVITYTLWRLKGLRHCHHHIGAKYLEGEKRGVWREVRAGGKQWLCLASQRELPAARRERTGSQEGFQSRCKVEMRRPPTWPNGHFLGAACLGSRERAIQGVRRGSLRPWLGILSGQGSVLPERGDPPAPLIQGCPSQPARWQVP